MTVETVKEYMQVIAKHYEKCKGIYLQTMYNIPFKLIDGGTATLKGLPEDAEEREDVAIMIAILSALTLEFGEYGHDVRTDILPEVIEKFKIMMSIEKLVARGYVELDKTKKDEYGFPAIKIIVPYNEWDMSEEA